MATFEKRFALMCLTWRLIEKHTGSTFCITDAASRVAKRASLRGEEAALTWGVEGGVDVEEAVAASASTSTSSTSIQAIARDGAQMSIPVAQMNIDQIRAKIYKKHGSIVNAFRHFDLDGNGRIDFDEFCDYLPTVSSSCDLFFLIDCT